MRAPVLLVLVAAAALSGCSGDTDPADAGETPVVVPPEQDAGAESAQSAEPRLTGPVRLRMQVGPAADQTMVTPVIGALRRYVTARTESVRAREVTPAMAQVSTLPWLNTQLDVVDQAASNGWTVPSTPVAQLAGAQVQGADALVQLCLWEPSTGFVVQRTGEPVEPGSESGSESSSESGSESSSEGWTPFDVKMVQVEGRWLVDGAALADHECTGG